MRKKIHKTNVAVKGDGVGGNKLENEWSYYQYFA